MWDETVARRGVCEIASCIYSYLNDCASNGITEVALYSDNYTGQNRNCFLVTMYIYMLLNTNLNTIWHNYSEKGHTQNENDSIRAKLRTKKADKLHLTADALSTFIINKLHSLGLDSQNCVRQCYDGASLMSGWANGVQAKIHNQFLYSLLRSLTEFGTHWQHFRYVSSATSLTQYRHCTTSFLMPIPDTKYPLQHSPSLLLWPVAYTTACTTVQAVMLMTFYQNRWNAQNVHRPLTLHQATGARKTVWYTRV